MTLYDIISEFNIILRKLKEGFLDDMERDAISRSIEELLADNLTPITIRKQLYSLKETIKL